MKRFHFACFTLSALFILHASHVAAEISERRVEYSSGDVQLVGFEYWDSEQTEKLPGVIIFSDWMGVGPFAKERARDLVADGYRAFVADIYGAGKAAADMEEAGKLATKFKSDRTLFRARARAAFDTFAKSPRVDAKNIGAMGFCFGGTASLELARTGAPLKGVVSFHGGLDTDDSSRAKSIAGRVLALHGADDPLVPPQEVDAFRKEMRDARVRWELTEYGGAVHSFTNPAAGNDPSKGFAYNAPVAARAYVAMQNFFDETLHDGEH